MIKLTKANNRNKANWAQVITLFDISNIEAQLLPGVFPYDVHLTVAYSRCFDLQFQLTYSEESLYDNKRENMEFIKECLHCISHCTSTAQLHVWRKVALIFANFIGDPNQVNSVVILLTKTELFKSIQPRKIQSESLSYELMQITCSYYFFAACSS